MLFGRKTLDRLVLDRADAVLFDALDAGKAGRLGRINFGGRDDLTVGRLQIEFDAGSRFFYNEFSHGFILSFDLTGVSPFFDLIIAQGAKSVNLISELRGDPL